MVKLIDGRKLAEKIKDNIVKEIIRLGSQPELTRAQNIIRMPRPNLAIVMVGQRPDSALYVKLKEKEAKKVGIDTHLYKCDAQIDEREIFSLIECLNQDDLIDAILVQLPLPAGFDTDGVIRAIDPAKDVDRFHPDNLEILFKTCQHDEIMPPVFAVVLEILKSINYDLSGRKVCLVVNSDIFGRGLAKVLICRGAQQVDLVKPSDKNLSARTKQADVLITAIGQKHFIKKNMVKDGAVVIDIGITREGKRVYGDVDPRVGDKAGYLTPVPGGVGPLTIAMLFKNTLALYKQRRGLK